MGRTPKPWYRKSRKCWFVTIGGVRHNLGPEKKAAYEHFYQLMRQPAQSKVSPHSLAAICDAYLDWVDKHRSPHTYEWYRCRLQRFLTSCSDMAVNSLRPFHVQTWVDQNPDNSPTTRRNNIRAVKTCLNWAVRQGYIERNPIEHMQLPTGLPRQVLITPVDFERMLTLIPDEPFRDLVTATWLTGCRPQESLHVEARHVDGTNARWVFPKSESKIKSMPRIVYLTDEAMAIVQRLMLKNDSGPLFLNTQGRPWNKQSVACAFDRLQVRWGKQLFKERKFSVKDYRVEKLVPRLKQTRWTHGREIPKTPTELRSEAKRKLTARIARRIAPRYSLYALRHSWATQALQNGVDALTVAILMGHKDPSTLARTYQHLTHNP